MIILLVVSDTHGRKAKLEETLKRQFAVDEKFRPTHIVHLGDGVEDMVNCSLCDRLCIHSVRGNCDSIFYTISNTIPYERVIELAGYRIAICHGHTFGVKSGEENAIEYAVSQNADMLMFGHTHVACSYTVKSGTVVNQTVVSKDLMVFNPGSLGYENSFGVVTLSESGIHTSIGKI